MNSAALKGNEQIVQETLESPCFRRIAGFINGMCDIFMETSMMISHMHSGAFKLFAPNVHADYSRVLDRVQSADMQLSRPFPNSVFAAATFNCGRRVVTLPHTDHHNYAAGWCAVIALGNYNPTFGGHLVLWDLKVMIEFPPGAVIFLPSAILRHSNTAVCKEETRMSFTQFSPGGLWRWEECGFQTQAEFLQSGGQFRVDGSARWLKALGRFSLMHKLKELGLP